MARDRQSIHINTTEQAYTHYEYPTSKADRDVGYTYISCTGCPRTINYSETTVNNRTQSSSYYSSDGTSSIVTNYQYDLDGRLVNRDGDLAQFDAAGQMIFHDSTGTLPDDSYSYDGNGALTKWVQTGTGAPFYYYLKSFVLGANVLELTSTGAMYKEYIFSGNGSQMAYLKDSTVTWLHEEPSGKERYEIKQDRTANSKITYDPTGATATSDGYSGGAPCPPQSCYSPANTPVMAMINRGFNGLEVLQSMRDQQRWQDSVFWNLQSYIDLGIRVGSNPPAGWDPVAGNLARISHDKAYIPGGGFGGFGVFSEGGAPIFGFGVFSLKPDPQQQTPPGGGGSETLSGCIPSLIASEFSDINVRGQSFSPVTNARFTEGIPSAIHYGNKIFQALGYRSVDPGAITLGFDIYYQPGFLDTSNPSWGQFESVVEEVSHLEQFLNNWSTMPNIRDIQEVGNRGQIQQFERAPLYADALESWATNYIQAYRNTPPGMDPYSQNAIEVPAKAKARRIIEKLQKRFPKRKTPCG